MIKAIIIDDVASARENLKQDISTYCPTIEIIGEAEGVVTGAKAIKELNPELVFLDIQMQDGSGFDLLEILPEINFKIIFTTASDAHAIKAFRFSAIDYLLKPMDPDDLMEAISKIEEQKSSGTRISLLKENMDRPKKLALNTLEKIHISNISDILRCESNVNYTMFYFADGSKLLVTKTLKEYDKMLSEYGFIRVHQSHLINSECIKEFRKLDGGHIIMKDDAKIPVSSRKRASVVELISNL